MYKDKRDMKKHLFHSGLAESTPRFQVVITSKLTRI